MQTDTALAERLAERTVGLVAIPSVSGSEAAILDHIDREIGALPRHGDEADPGVRLYAHEPRGDRPFVVLAGHVDTVPGGPPLTRTADEVSGRGSADMKAGLAVMLELARVLGSAGRDDLPVDVGYCFFGREELPFAESALLPFLRATPLIERAALAIVLEPTGNALEVGCLGNLNADLVFSGRSAHSARPWHGENAIHAAIHGLREIASTQPRDVEIDGLVYREVVNVTSIAGGTARNVLPAEARAGVNYRYAPDRSPGEAEEQLRRWVISAGVRIEVIGNAPAGAVPEGNELVQRLRSEAGSEPRPKQAWTPVAEFGLVGVDAVNFGPGDPALAHTDHERVRVGDVVGCYDVLYRLLTGRSPGESR
ncbi:MAG: succinyl-diaminopimelate desuccinylase [Actinomycetota bacterium]